MYRYLINSNEYDTSYLFTCMHAYIRTNSFINLNLHTEYNLVSVYCMYIGYICIVLRTLSHACIYLLSQTFQPQNLEAVSQCREKLLVAVRTLDEWIEGRCFDLNPIARDPQNPLVRFLIDWFGLCYICMYGMNIRMRHVLINS